MFRIRKRCGSKTLSLIYSDTTQLNWTSSWVELCRCKRVQRRCFFSEPPTKRDRWQWPTVGDGASLQSSWVELCRYIVGL